MKFLQLLLLPVVLYCHPLTIDGEDYTLFHHVDVLTGSLRLTEEDLYVEGAEPLTLVRTYSSDSGEWHLLEYLNLFVDMTDPPYAVCQNVSYRLTNEENGTFHLQSSDSDLALSNSDAIITMADGTIRHYQNAEEGLYCLSEEILPNKNRLLYSYDEHRRLTEIASTNPDKTKTYAWIRIEPDGKMISSTGQWLQYHFVDENLCCVEGSSRPKEEIRYNALDQIEEIQISNSLLKIAYNSTGAVESIEAPLDGDMLCPLARFSYDTHVTEAIDSEGHLIRYHHTLNHLQSIEYFDEQKRLSSAIHFYWNESKLVCQARLDENSRCLYANHFSYDAQGRLIEEAIYGDLIGNPAPLLTIDSNGQPTGAECLTKRYSYDGSSQRILNEDTGNLVIRYEYLHDSNQLAAKFTCDREKILIREFFINGDLWIEKTIDDGSFTNPLDLTGITERRRIRCDLDPDSGLPSSISESYWDVDTQSYHLLKKEEFVYSSAKKIIEQKIFDSKAHDRYSIFFTYDAFGRLTEEVFPYGKNSFRYDDLGHLLEEKRIGSEKKTYQYDRAGRRIITQGSDSTHIQFDLKGRPLAIESNQGIVHQTYDAFGRCTEARSENGQMQHSIFFSYDAIGNLTQTIAPLGETTKTTYNFWKKPTRTIRPDGSEIIYHYNLDGTLAESIDPDATKTTYSYDQFQRATSKKTMSRAEAWQYSSFRLRTYVDAMGQTTNYCYDGAGRKIKETIGNKSLCYQYDELGFLEKTSTELQSHIERHDLMGRIIEQYDENSIHQIENYIQFYYDDEGRQTKTVRKTASGDAIDLFSYDDAGRLTLHTDPQGAVWQIEYRVSEDESKQSVRQKWIRNPLGNITVESFDLSGHLIKREKKSPDGQTLSTEEFFFDASGNEIRRQKDQLCIEWQRDSMGRVIQEIEGGQMVKRFIYDPKGRLIEQIQPNQVHLFFSYDGFDRLTELKSSDGSVHYQYAYALGADPISILDLVHAINIEKSFDSSLNPTHEKTGFLHYSRSYDAFGRCILFTLPDQSSIAYEYIANHLSRVERSSQLSHRYELYDPNGWPCRQCNFLGEIIETSRDLRQRVISEKTPQMCQSVSFGVSGLVSKYDNNILGKTEFHYDALDQLISENSTSTPFDSSGNPIDAEIDNCSRILTQGPLSIHYDANGNVIEKISTDSALLYRYDALCRLVEITMPKTKKTLLTYDPLSRLYSMEIERYQNDEWQREEISYFLYDGEEEIGRIDENGQILELKIIPPQKPCANAVAIELQGQTYFPQHNVFGSIVALSNHQETIPYALSAFGEEKSTVDSPKCPWRYCSKRAIDHLVFFGRRFYDPSLKRWLTPDPAGWSDSANRYAYVHNCPLNRIDPYGFLSELFFRIDLPIASLPVDPSVIHCKGVIGDHKVDWVVSCGFWQKLQLTPEELKVGTINLVDHLADLTPSSERSFGLLTYQNGIKTTLPHFAESCLSIANKIPEGTLLIGLHNKTKGMARDLIRLLQEISNTETPIVTHTRQFMEALVENLHKINPNFLWGHILHSEAGAIAKRAIEGMTPIHQDLLRKHLYLFAVGSVAFLPVVAMNG